MTSPLSRKPGLIVSLLFFTIAVDGYDTISLALSVPSLSRDWGLPPAAFTFPLVATNIGAVLGYMAAGPLSARIGRRSSILVAIVAFTLATFATVLADSVATMGLIRLVTGVGLGAVLPAAVSLAADLVTTKWRDSTSVVVTMGLGTGAILGGLVGSRLIASWGWTAVFWFGGALSTVLFVLLWWFLSDVPVAAGSAVEVRKLQGVGALFRAGLRTSTLLLWAFAFLVSIVSYSLLSWLPTFLLEFGFSPANAALGTSLLGLGVLVAGVTLAGWARQAGAALPIVVLLGVAFVCLLTTALPVGVGIALTLLAFAIVGISSGSVGQSALPVGIYPRPARTTAVGFTTAAGRIGGIVGPLVSGVLLAIGVPAGSIITWLALPIGLAWICVLVVLRRARRPAPALAEASSAPTAAEPGAAVRSEG